MGFNSKSMEPHFVLLTNGRYAYRNREISEDVKHRIFGAYRIVEYVLLLLALVLGIFVVFRVDIWKGLMVLLTLTVCTVVFLWMHERRLLQGCPPTDIKPTSDAILKAAFGKIPKFQRWAGVLVTLLTVPIGVTAMVTGYSNSDVGDMWRGSFLVLVGIGFLWLAIWTHRMHQRYRDSSQSTVD